MLVTTDANLKYQQNLTSRKLAIVVLSTTSWPRIHRVADAVLAAVDSAAPGKYLKSRFHEDAQPGARADHPPAAFGRTSALYVLST